MALIACAVSSSEVSLTILRRCGSAVWSITPTDQPSGSSQMVRIALPSTFMASTYQILAGSEERTICGNLPAGHASRNVAGGFCGGSLCMAAIDYEAEYNNRARVPEHE